MSVVVIDDATREKLLAADEYEVEVRDESGAVVGKFIRSQRAEDYEILGELASEEEIERRRREDPVFTAEQVEERLRDHSWFIAFAPAEAPQIAVAVLVENGGFGASAAGPIARGIMDAYLLPRLPKKPAAETNPAPAEEAELPTEPETP